MQRMQTDHFEEQYGFHNNTKTEFNTDSRPSRVTLQPISEIKRMQTNPPRGHSYQPNSGSQGMIMPNQHPSIHGSQKANRASGQSTVKKQKKNSR